MMRTAMLGGVAGLFGYVLGLVFSLWLPKPAPDTSTLDRVLVPGHHVVVTWDDTLLVDVISINATRRELEVAQAMLDSVLALEDK